MVVAQRSQRSWVRILLSAGLFSYRTFQCYEDFLKSGPCISTHDVKLKMETLISTECPSSYSEDGLWSVFEPETTLSALVASKKFVSVTYLNFVSHRF